MLRRFFLLLLFFVGAPALYAQCSVENFTDFESGSNGAAITPTLLVSSTHGYTTVASSSFPNFGLWTVDDSTVSSVLKFGTAANFPLQTATGVLCGNSTNYSAGVGSLGMVGTGLGSGGGRHYVQLTLPTGLQLSTLSTSVWLCSDVAASDSATNPDVLDIHSTSDFAAINYLGNGVNRYVNMETGSTGFGGNFAIQTGNCGPGGNWYRFEITLGQSGGASNTMKAWDASGTLVGSVSSASINTGTAATSFIGCPGNPTAQVTSGKHCYFDSWQIYAPGTGGGGGGGSCSATPTQSSVQNCLNTIASGGTVNISAGSASWNASPAVTVSAKKVTIIGATTCTGTGDPGGGTSGVVSCTDNTNITLTACGAMALTGSASNFVDVSGITFIDNVQCFGNPGVVNMLGTHGQQSFRFHHNHIKGSASQETVGMSVQNGYGLVDHNYFQDIGGNLIPLNTFGDMASNGYQNWTDPSQIGTNNAIYIEQNYYTIAVTNNEGFIDCYFGAKNVVRFNTINGTEIGGCHGTDTHSRSPVYWEEYGNHITNNTGNGPYEMGHERGGTSLVWREHVDGSTFWSKWTLAYNRLTQQVGAEISNWGAAAPGLNWTPTAINSTDNTLNAPAFISSHAYNTHDVFTSGGTNWEVSSNCTSGSAPSAAQGSFTTTGSCTVQNVAGVTTASPAPGVSAGFDPANPDTQGTTSAFTRFFDANGGVYPYRDQPCVGHNQVNMPCYEWLNSVPGSLVPLFHTDGAVSVVANRDYYDYTGSTSVTNGVGAGALASRPASCVTGVAYFATDQGSWNTSSNGSGNGVLYKCTSTNTWTSYYTPYTYPFVTGAGGTAPQAPTALTLTSSQ